MELMKSSKILFPLSPYNQQRQHQKAVWVYPVYLAMFATYLRDQGHEIFWDSSRYDYFEDADIDRVISDDFCVDVSFDKLPIPDRILTDAKNPRWQSHGNYKFHPATHMMVSNLCWYGKCAFCIDALNLKCGMPRYVRSVYHVVQEIDGLIAQGYKEVFDDSGTFPVGQWLETFCRAMRMCGRNQKIVLGCNMRALELDYKMMAASGFRFMVVGLESASQETLDRIDKGQTGEKMVTAIKAMTEAGLEVHATVMFGYPWETHHDAMRTVNWVHHLLKKGHIKTVQASVFMPPRTVPPKKHPAQKYVQKIYSVYRYPWYWRRKINDIKHFEDLVYLLKRLDHIRKAQ